MSVKTLSTNMLVTSFLVIYLLIFQCGNVLTTEIQLDRFEILNSTHKEGFYNFSELLITRINRTTYVLNFQTTIYKDIDANCEFEISFHHNRLNNNQYKKTPFSIPRQLCCQPLEMYYKTAIMPSVKRFSNFPQLKAGEPVCPIRKV